tara:strand:+ start:168 stop:449 length:282 start_codon:yes stop_codon:yes gene_type:complete
MTIRVLFFASCREIAGSSQVDLSVREGITVGELKNEIVATYPDLAGIAPSLSTAVNMEYASDDDIISSNDEVALIPPVSGGAGNSNSSSTGTA